MLTRSLRLSFVPPFEPLPWAGREEGRELVRLGQRTWRGVLVMVWELCGLSESLLYL